MPLRMRPDLIVRLQLLGGDRYWVVKDPVALTYFHLRDEEHAILQMLDGRTSLAEIKERFEQLFAPLQTRVEHLYAFLGRLHRCGLVLSDAPGQGDQMLLRRGQQQRQAWLQSITGILAVRFPGIDPEALLVWLHPKCRWLFSRWSVACGLLLAIAALVLALAEHDVVASRLPDFHAFFSARNVVWLVAALALAKVLHELGHALACKHLGGECHEMGIMLLVFTPCLYCNVSDAWMLPNKWHRVIISSAGMYVEIVLASVAAFLWWFSEPGLLNSMCLDVMFVCSVSTILFNGNPLLRYDGYYILSDILEVPNLGQQSRALLGRALAKSLLGLESPPDRSLPEGRRWLVAAYGAASTAYRWCVVIAILWFCHKVLSAHRLELLGEIMAAVVIGGLFMAPLWSLAQSARNPAWRQGIRRGRVILTGGALAVLAVAVLAVPLPFRITAPVVFEPQDGRRAYVSVPGTLVSSVAEGTVVKQGQALAVLEDLDVQRQIEELTGQRNRQRLHLKQLEFRLGDDPSLAPQIPSAREALADVEERLRQRQRDHERLTLKAPAAGTVLPPPIETPRPYVRGRLQTWWGNPLDARNLGSRLETGTLFCVVGDPSRVEAVLVVDQSDLVFVKSGQRVRMRLGELPAEVLGGTVMEIAKADLEVVPRELAASKELPARVDENGIPRPVDACYQVRVSLDEHDRPILTGASGRAKIIAARQPLGQRLYRYLRRTFGLPF